MPDFELPTQVPAQPTLDTTRLTSLLLASTLMQTMKARTEETQHEDNAFRALQAVASTTSVTSLNMDLNNAREPLLNQTKACSNQN